MTVWFVDSVLKSSEILRFSGRQTRSAYKRATAHTYAALHTCTDCKRLSLALLLETSQHKRVHTHSKYTFICKTWYFSFTRKT
jgi:hypothetical protein